MLINVEHRRWIAVTVAAVAIATAVYVVSIRASVGRASAGSRLGLAFGIAGTIAMVVAGLLAARKRVRLWRIGAARVWMAMHIWLGILAVPLVWFHSSFRMGGAFTTLLMLLFYLVTASGI